MPNYAALIANISSVEQQRDAWKVFTSKITVLEDVVGELSIKLEKVKVVQTTPPLALASYSPARMLLIT